VSTVRGQGHALIATVSTPLAASVIAATRLRKGSANSTRGATRLVADALITLATTRPPSCRPGELEAVPEQCPSTAGSSKNVLVRAGTANGFETR